MVDENLKVLEDKVTDYKRFAFILLALNVFLFIGLIIPNDGITQIQQAFLIITSILSLISALFFHKKAMKYKEELYSSEEQ